MKYTIAYSEQADKDLDNLFDAITYDYLSPVTAFRYVQGVVETIEKMSCHPDLYPLRFNKSFFPFGQFVRRVDYKKMAILYTLFDDVVYIHRIIAASLIT